MNAYIDELVKTTAEAVKRELEIQDFRGLTFTGTTNTAGEMDLCGDGFSEWETVQGLADNALRCVELGDCVASDDFDIDHNHKLWQHVIVTFSITDGQVANVSGAVRSTRKQLAQYMLENGALVPEECEDLDKLDEPEPEPEPCAKRARHVIDLTAE